ncbi:MAG: PIN domain-containing protein [Alphaproteobacteria bacterium]|nr:PIN domain-containing protein [Alphaproteobacteria bacterium]
MTERLSLDASILFYSADAQSGSRHARAVDIVKAAASSDCVLTIQALAEFYRATTRKGALSRTDAAREVDELSQVFDVVGPEPGVLTRAVAAAKAGRFSIWDGLMLATIEQAGCTLLLSEDMGDGARFGAVAIVNPFRGTSMPKRAAEALGL